MLNYTLHLQELIRSGKMKPEHESEQNKILKVYLCGNLEKGIITGSRRLLVNSNARHHVPASQVNKIIQIEEYLMKKLVYKRNVKMARRIDEILRANKSVTFFFAIGTGKLIRLFCSFCFSFFLTFAPIRMRSSISEAIHWFLS